MANALLAINLPAITRPNNNGLYLYIPSAKAVSFKFLLKNEKGHDFALRGEVDKLNDTHPFCSIYDLARKRSYDANNLAGPVEGPHLGGELAGIHQDL